MSAYKDIVPQSLVPIRDSLFCIGSLNSAQISGVCIISIVEKEIKKRGGGTLDRSQSWADYIVYVRDETDIAQASNFAKKHGIEMLELFDLLCSLVNAPELSEEEQSQQLTEYEFSEKMKAEKRARIAAEKLGKKRPCQNGLTASDKKYLAAITHLVQNGANVKTKDVAAYLNVSKSSASAAIKKLCDKGYISYGFEFTICLSESIEK